MRSYLESLCSNLRAHTITNVQSNDDKVGIEVPNYSYILMKGNRHFHEHIEFIMVEILLFQTKGQFYFHVFEVFLVVFFFMSDTPL